MPFYIILVYLHYTCLTPVRVQSGSCTGSRLSISRILAQTLSGHNYKANHEIEKQKCVAVSVRTLGFASPKVKVFESYEKRVKVKVKDLKNSGQLRLIIYLYCS